MTGYLVEHKLAVLLIVWLVLLVLLVTVWSRGAIRRNERGSLGGPPDESPRFTIASLPPDIQAQIHEAVRERRTIDAIKLLREATGMDLAAAKDMVDAMDGPA